MRSYHRMRKFPDTLVTLEFLVTIESDKLAVVTMVTISMYGIFKILW